MSTNGIESHRPHAITTSGLRLLGDLLISPDKSRGLVVLRAPEQLLENHQQQVLLSCRICQKVLAKELEIQASEIAHAPSGIQLWTKKRAWVVVKVIDHLARQMLTSVNKLLHAAKTASPRQTRLKQVQCLIHELRGPLACLLTRTEVPPQATLASEPSAFAKELFADPRTNFATLTSDLNHLDAVAEAWRLGRDPVLNKKPFTIRNLVQCLESWTVDSGVRHIVSFQGSNPAGAATASPSDAEPLLGDEQKLRQILFNLMSNAVKFTPRDKATRPPLIEIVITFLGYSEDNEAIYRFEVKNDSDRALTLEEQKRLFAKRDNNDFVQLDDHKSHSDIESSGLGLLITQTFVRMMGGDICVTSPISLTHSDRVDDSTGVSMSFQLHFARKGLRSSPVIASPLHPIRTLESSSHDKSNILIVDDDLGTRKLLQKQIDRGTQYHRANWEISNDGNSAVEVCRITPYDVVVLDRHMSELDGFGTAKMIAAIYRDKGWRIPTFIMHSGSSEAELRGECGADMPPFEVHGKGANMGALLTKALSEADRVTTTRLPAAALAEEDDDLPSTGSD